MFHCIALIPFIQENTAMARCFGYVRLALGKKSTAGQREAIEKYFQEQLKPTGCEWGGVYEDGSEAGRRELRCRSAGLRLSLATESDDVIVIADSARAFSGLADLLDTIRIWAMRGVNVILLDFGQLDTSTPLGQVALNILARGLALDRASHGEKIARELRRRRLEGRPTGTAPLGYRIVGSKGKKRLVPDEEVLALARQVIQWRTEDFTWESIYWCLIKRGVQRRNGTEWSIPALQRLYQAGLRLEATRLKWETAATPESGGEG